MNFQRFWENPYTYLCVDRDGLGSNPGPVADNPLNRPPPYCTEFGNGDFLPWGHVHVRSRTEKRPSSRPLLLSNRPLFAVYMPYLLSYCAGATSCPGPAVVAAAPPLALACAASVSCVMGHGEWLCCCCICCCCICCCCSPEAKKFGRVPPAQAPMLLLLPPPFSPSCCLCCGYRCCLAFLVVLLL